MIFFTSVLFYLRLKNVLTEVGLIFCLCDTIIGILKKQNAFEMISCCSDVRFACALPAVTLRAVDRDEEHKFAVSGLSFEERINGHLAGTGRGPGGRGEPCLSWVSPGPVE